MDRPNNENKQTPMCFLSKLYCYCFETIWQSAKQKKKKQKITKK